MFLSWTMYQNTISSTIIEQKVDWLSGLIRCKTAYHWCWRGGHSNTACSSELVCTVKLAISLMSEFLDLEVSIYRSKSLFFFFQISHFFKFIFTLKKTNQTPSPNTHARTSSALAIDDRSLPLLVFSGSLMVFGWLFCLSALIGGASG